MRDETDSGIAAGLRVVEISSGIAVPIAGMLLADIGADVVRVVAPDTRAPTPGEIVWSRGKRVVELDLDLDDPARLDDLLANADVLLESTPPDLADARGLSPRSLGARHPSLVHTSITGYGRATPHTGRPPIESLVTARTGMQWDQRGYYGTRMEHIMGIAPERSSFDVPVGAEQTGCREGPIFMAVPWVNLGAALLASAGTAAALHVRDRTGRGQHVETSLLQAAMMENAMGWQRVARMHPSYRLWYFDRRAPKGLFATLDGRWLHQWAPFHHEFLRDHADAERLEGGPLAPVSEPVTDYEAQVERECREYVESARAVATRTLDDWVERFAAAGLAAQPVRSPEDGLFDAALEREGTIVELDDPVLGPIRQVGHIFNFSAVPNPPIAPRPPSPEPVEDIAQRWSAPATRRAPEPDSASMPPAPLAGVTVLDFGLAIAGPYGPQILADLGATVIKITARGFSLTDAIYVGSTQGKQALAIDLKSARGTEIARRLIATADIVHHNMRPGVAERLGIGYDDCRRVKPDIIYCHTRGFEQDGPRTGLPGNDQMGAALAGTEFEGGGTIHGTPPIWYTLAFGDTANGVGSAVAVVHALRHRDRTGEGQFVGTSILNVSMLFSSTTYVHADGHSPERERIDAEQYGFSAGRRIYRTAEGWLCVHLRDADDWASLTKAIDDPVLADVDLEAALAPIGDQPALNDRLASTFATDTASRWFERLDDVGVPCEVSSATFAREAFDEPRFRDLGWLIENPHPHLGRVEQVGMPFSFSECPDRNLAGAPITGQHSRVILRDLGFTDNEIDAFVADEAVLEADVKAAAG